MNESAQQLKLFGPQPVTPKAISLGLGEPLSHRNDPLSSYRAADRSIRSGRIRNQTQKVLAAVRELQGQTSWELAVRIGCDRHMPARRLAALARRGLIRRGPLKRCRICKQVCLTWWPR